LLEIPHARMFDNEITQQHQGTSPVTPLTLNQIETDTLYNY